MQKIIWIGQPLFASALESCGFDSIFVLSPLQDQRFSWTGITAAAGFTPDLVVIAPQDDCAPVDGVEDFPCIKVFYAQRASPWAINYAQTFDFCVVPGDHLAPLFLSGNLDSRKIWVIPPFAEDIPPSAAPCRKEFLIAPGDCAEIYREALASIPFQMLDKDQYPGVGSLVLCPATDVNDVQILNYMACGSCVVAPRKRPAIEKMFVDGEHWVGYAPGDPGDALYRVKFLSERPELVRHIAVSAREIIASGHRAEHRAWLFTDKICDLAMLGAFGYGASGSQQDCK